MAFVVKMPRTRAQQDCHNERRRKAQSNGRKAIFSMEYIEIKYPEIYNEACKFFTVIDSKYPEKHDLRKTKEFLSFKESPELMKNMSSTELEPLLEIPLMSIDSRNTTSEQEIAHATDQIMEQSTPLRTVTAQTNEMTIDQEIPPVSLNEMTIDQEIPPVSLNDIDSNIIDQIIEQLRQDPDLDNAFNDLEQQIEFNELGQDLDIPELNLLEQELSW